MRRDPQDTAQRLYEIASAQGGYFTSAQALEAGYTYRQQHDAEEGNHRLNQPYYDETCHQSLPIRTGEISGVTIYKFSGSGTTPAHPESSFLLQEYKAD